MPQGQDKYRTAQGKVSILRVLFRLRPEATISTRVFVEEDSNRSIIEIDGAFIRILRGAVELYIVEAKAGHARGSEKSANLSPYPSHLNWRPGQLSLPVSIVA